MFAECLRLWFPQWQGSGNTLELHKGALEIRDALLRPYGFTRIEVGTDTGLAVEHDILGYGPIRRQLQSAVDVISRQNPERVFTVGGGCGVELAPVSYLNQYYGGDLAVVWFDAHGDLNTPESSRSKLFHGMPLRTLLGEGDEAIVGQCVSHLVPGQVILSGCRELDPEEETYVRRYDVPVLDGDMASLMDAIEVKGSTNLYIHVDLDVLDPVYFPSVMCPVGGGITMEELMETLWTLKDAYNIVGFSVTEYAPGYDADVERLRDIIEYGYGLSG